MNKISNLFDETPHKILKGSRSCFDHFNYLITLSIYPNYKTVVAPIVTMSWYNQLSDKFPLLYKQTFPDLKSGLDSFKEFNKDRPFLDSSFLSLSSLWLRKMTGMFKKSKILDFNEISIYMEKQTTPGFPFRDVKKGHYLFDEKFLVLIAYVESRLLLLKNPFIWKWSQKRELRTLEKNELRKIRGFCVGPVDHCYLTTKYYADFNENFYSHNNSDFPSAVGMSKYFRGFDELARKLIRHPNIFSTDFSGFDSCISFQLLIESFYYKSHYMLFDKDSFKIMWGLLVSTSFSHVIIETGDVHTKNGGNPSGQSNTIVDNTIVNILLFTFCYLVSTKGTAHCSYDTFRKNIFFKCYGDDCIFSVSDELLPFFNVPVWKTFCSSIGFTLKGNDVATDIFGAEFLSHHVVFDGVVFLPVPDRDKMLSSLVLGSTEQHPLFNAMRAMSLRVETWADPYVRALVNDFIHYCYENCNEDMQGYFELAPDQRLDLPTLNRLYFTDEEIYILYSGFESNTGNILNKLSQFKKICSYYLFTDFKFNLKTSIWN